MKEKTGTIESYEGRGVWVRPGLTARAIMAGAKVIERECEVGHYTARRITADVLEAVASGDEIARTDERFARYGTDVI